MRDVSADGKASRTPEELNITPRNLHFSVEPLARD